MIIVAAAQEKHAGLSLSREPAGHVSWRERGWPLPRADRLPRRYIAGVVAEKYEAEDGSDAERYRYYP